MVAATIICRPEQSACRIEFTDKGIVWWHKIIWGTKRALKKSAGILQGEVSGCGDTPNENIAIPVGRHRSSLVNGAASKIGTPEPVAGIVEFKYVAIHASCITLKI